MSEPLEAYRSADPARGRATTGAGVPRVGGAGTRVAGTSGDATDGRADAEAAVEATWPERIRSDDARAFEAMVRRYTVRLRVYAERHVHAPTLAEELVEDVFVDVWERRASWKVRTSVRRYLYGAVRKAALHALRSRRNRERIHRAMREDGRSPAMAEPEPSPEDRLEVQQLEGALREVMDGLPDRAREAFLLARRHELSHAEIAEVMGISTSTVEKHIGRAMRALRETLSAWMTEAP